MTRRGDGRTRVLLYFLLGILLPSVLLGYLAFRGIENERALVERERRNELQAVADRLRAAVDRRLMDLERRVSSADSGELETLVEENPAIRAVFTADSAGDIRVVAADGLFFRRDPGPGREAAAEEPEPLLARARRRELGEGNLEGALELYSRVLRDAEADHVRAEALAGVARVQRKLGRGAPSAESYERLRSELGSVRSSAGIPFGAAADLELASLHLERGDTARAARIALELYGGLVEGRWALTAARFDLLTSATREILETLASAGGRPALADTLRSLSVAEGRERAEAAALRAFEENAGRLLLRADPGEGPTRGSVDTGTRSFPAVLLPTESGDAAESGNALRRGWIVDAGALVREAAGAAIGDEAGRFSWHLRAPGGEIVAASEAREAPETPAVSAELGRFLPWTVRIAHSPDALAGGLLTSRRAVYLYAFLLIAGILLSGLFLTLRTVGRELELARMKSDFVSTVSHEFKSPLTAIRQLAEMLRSGRVRSEERRERYYEVLLEQSERLSLLVDNVLDFARLEEGRRELSPEPMNPASLVEETVADARGRVAHEGFSIRTELADPLPTTALDRDAFRQALGNLIDNGVKYSGDSREVVVRGYRENGGLVVAVQDFGIGMSPEEAARAFDRFHRGGDELTRTVKGTGLGLTLVKQIVEAHGGAVEVRSEPGRGSTFAMRFPAAEAATPTDRAGAGASGRARDDDSHG